MALKDFWKNNPIINRNTPGNGSAGGGQKPDGEKIASRLSAILVPVVVVLVLIRVLAGSFYTLSETESAVVTTLGQATVNNNKGLQFKIPFIQEVTKINTTVRSFEVGYEESSDGSYRYEESSDGSYRNVESESTMITSDMNFVDIDFYVTYQVTDPLQYMYASEVPELILKNLVQSTIRGTVSAYTVDSALTTGKSEIQQNIKNIVMDELPAEHQKHCDGRIGRAEYWTVVDRYFDSGCRTSHGSDQGGVL